MIIFLSLLYEKNRFLFFFAILTRASKLSAVFHGKANSRKASLTFCCGIYILGSHRECLLVIYEKKVYSAGAKVLPNTFVYIYNICRVFICAPAPANKVYVGIYVCGRKCEQESVSIKI